ncbi:MAG TPA: hypothetical protein VJJ24_00355 [Candidatus Paceibacterota bacterium]|uniref:Uncharacterized protein n=1 Tax=Candidatus Yanofskybacteria bacterium RIFCSPHIGHO2_02_FULL_50_12 TaxID=1802685 RepID=A0A1F8FUQ7_9BACT|nr:MAG: hypothetical protein A3C88_00370 [Candidatus Yanofskybacteria bacterium RIFCSPHIGHO2_02_FULL_50_12]
MKALTELQKKAVALRLKGLSYNEIRKHIGVAKSSLSLWLKDIELRPEQRARLYSKQIQVLSLGTQSQRERRKREVDEIIKTAEREVSIPLSPDVLRLMGAALYWAEGSKRGMCEVTNSDPHLIYFMVRWIEAMFNISSNNLKARLNIYSQQDDKAIKKFWSELTGIPVENFGKSFVKPVSTGFKKNNLYYGTIKIEIPKSTDVKHRIFGWITAALRTDAKVGLVQQRWQSLREVKRPVNL